MAVTAFHYIWFQDTRAVRYNRNKLKFGLLKQIRVLHRTFPTLPHSSVFVLPNISAGASESTEGPILGFSNSHRTLSSLKHREQSWKPWIQRNLRKKMFCNCCCLLCVLEFQILACDQQEQSLGDSSTEQMCFTELERVQRGMQLFF